MFSESLFKIRGATNKGRIILWLMIVAIVSVITWSYFAVLDEVAIGEGKVVPSKRGQFIQNLEGGILSEITVKEGETVEEGQILASLNPIQARANIEEITARIIPLKARAARLAAEINDKETIDFPQELAGHAEVMERERMQFQVNRRAFTENVENLTKQLKIAEEQLEIAKPLRKNNAVSEVEVLRMEQNVAELSSRVAAATSEYYVALRDDYANTMSSMEPLLKSQSGLDDQLTRTVIRSPTRGIVKDIRVTTIGGVLSPGGVLMEIVPIEDQLLIEARLNPRDIAFIHPGQEANVKITAYDSGVYGSIPAVVQNISPDTIEDDVDRRLYYYRAYVLTNHNYLETKDGKQHPIRPGMVATAEIRTGQKTVFSYLMKPLNRAGEALRER